MRPLELADHSEIPLILKTIKNLFKARGLHYQDAAARLGVSETTVKRYLTGHGLTVDILEKVCALVDIRLTDLLDMSRMPDRSLPNLSEEKEQDLASDPFLAALFYLLSQGYTPEALQRDFSLSDQQIADYLATLERLKLIQLFPLNRIKIKIRRNFTVTRGGPLMKLVREALLTDLFKRFDITDEDWMITYAKLSVPSLQRIRELQQEFVKAIFAIAAEDKDLPSDVADWNGIFFMMRPIDIGGLRNWRPTANRGAVETSP
jgi:transcriptional regulator with XRE-family HTH domain